MAKPLGMPLPGLARAAAVSAPAAPMPPAEEEGGESYDITPEEYAALGQDKTVTCGNGVTINLTEGGGTEAPMAESDFE